MKLLSAFLLVFAASATELVPVPFEWDPSPTAGVAYRLYWGTNDSLLVNGLSAVLPLPANEPSFVCAVAVGTNQVESLPSNVVKVTPRVESVITVGTELIAAPAIGVKFESTHTNQIYITNAAAVGDMRFWAARATIKSEREVRYE